MLGNQRVAGILFFLCAGQAAIAQDHPWLRVDAVGERTVSIEMSAGIGDRIVRSSVDSAVWDDTGLRIPSGRTLSFSFAKPGEMKGFYRIDASAEMAELAGTIPSPSGMELAELTGTSEFSSGYCFRPDGTGSNYSLYRDSSIADAFWDLSWTVLEAQAGVMTLRLDYPDGYMDLLNLQFLANGAIAAVLTWDEGSEGVAGSEFFALEPKPAPPETGGAPNSLDGTTWDLALFGDPAHLVSFESDGSATGPNLRTGAPGAWSHTYIKTGSNTATLHVTDAAGNFTRFFLSFFPSGEEADFYASSATVPTLFGTGDSFGSFQRHPASSGR